MDSSRKLAKYTKLNSEDYALEIERELLRIIKNVERKISRDKRTATNKTALKRKKEQEREYARRLPQKRSVPKNRQPLITRSVSCY